MAEVSNVWVYQARYRVPLPKATAGAHILMTLCYCFTCPAKRGAQCDRSGELMLMLKATSSVQRVHVRGHTV